MATLTVAKKSVGKVVIFLSFLILVLNPVNAEMLPSFEGKLPVGSYAHTAALGDGTPDEVLWSSAEYLAELDAQIDQLGFTAATGLVWSKNSEASVAMNSESNLTLVVFEFDVDTPMSAFIELSAAQGFAWYYRDHNGEVQHHVDNYRQQLASREVFDIRPVIPLRFEPGHTYRVFVATFVFLPGAIVSFDLWQPESFRANRAAFYLTEGMFFGFVATIAITSLLLALAFRQVVYLFFSGFLISSAATIYAFTGFTLLFGLGDKVYLSVPLISALYGTSAAFANLFSMYFLEMWSTQRRLYWVYFALMILSLVIGLYPSLSGGTADSIATVLFLTGPALIVGQTAHLYSLFHYFKKNRNVIYWWAGMTVYSGSMVVSLASAGEAFDIGNAPQLTIVVDALLLLILLVFNFKGEQTSRRVAQQSSLESLRLARDLEKSRSTFVAAVGHDLRGPVQAISHFSASLKQSATEVARQRLDKIDENILSISEMLDSMIILSRVDWQASQPQVEPVALRSALLELRSTFLGKAAEKHLELEVETTDCAVMTDRVCLGQILRNLTDNAIKYTEEGYVRIRVIALESTVKIVVEDSGVGIAREDLSNIFEEFYRGDHAENTATGTGLGLSIVARLARLLGIRISVSSDANTGSQFELEMPRSELPEEEVPASEVALSGMEKTKIAIVSSDLIAFSDVAELLTRWGAQVITGETMPSDTVDLLVIDTAAKNLVKLDENIPLVVIEPDISPMKLRRLVHRQLNPM